LSSISRFSSRLNSALSSSMKLRATVLRLSEGAGAMLAGDHTTEGGCLASSRRLGPARRSGSAW
jgi:hypothetical protein